MIAPALLALVPLSCAAPAAATPAPAAPAEDLVLAAPASGELALFDVLGAYGEAQGLHVLASPAARTELESTSCAPFAGLTVPAAEAAAFVEDLLRWHGFVVSDLRDEEPRVLGVHSLALDHGRNARYRPVTRAELAELADRAALLVEVRPTVQAVDLHQTVVSLRPLLPRDTWHLAILAGRAAPSAEGSDDPAAGGTAQLVLRGTAREVAAWLDVVEHLCAPRTAPARAPAGAPAQADDDETAAAPEPLRSAFAALLAVQTAAAARGVTLTDVAADFDRRRGAVRVRADLIARGAGDVEATKAYEDFLAHLESLAPGHAPILSRTTLAGSEDGTIRASGLEVWLDLAPSPGGIAAPGGVRNVESLLRSLAADREVRFGPIDLTPATASLPGDRVLRSWRIRPSDRGRAFTARQVQSFLVLVETRGEPLVVTRAELKALDRDTAASGAPEAWTFEVEVSLVELPL